MQTINTTVVTTQPQVVSQPHFGAYPVVVTLANGQQVLSCILHVCAQTLRVILHLTLTCECYMYNAVLMHVY